MLAGADFIKTSTGKVSPAATLPVTLVMLEAVRDFRAADGPAGRRQGGGRHPHRQGRHPLPRRRQRDVRRRLARAPTGSASAPRRCSTTCSCSARSSPPAATPAPTTSPSTDGLHRVRLRPRPRVAPRSSTSPRATGCSSTARWSTPIDGSRFKTVNPATEEVLSEVAAAGPARRRPGRRRGPRRVRRHVVPPARARPRQVPVPHRPPGPGALPRAGRARVDRQRQAHPREPRRRPAAGGRALLLLRRLGRQAGLRRLRPRPPAARRRRPGHPLELPAADAGVEDRARPGLRQHGGAQAGRDHAAHRPRLRRHLPAGRPAARRRQHRHRRRRHRARRSSSTPASTRWRSPARPRWAARSPGRSPAPARS